MARCNKCIRGARASTTGVNPAGRTLKIDLGGAAIYITPGNNGVIDVTVNAENLLEGDYIVSTWKNERWTITDKNG